MSSETDVNITPMQNGPYLVKNLKQLSNVKGPIESAETVALCRCGASSNKPFCDGSHRTIGFNSDKTDGRLTDKKEVYIGTEITINDNRSICAHSGVCTDNLSAVFRLKQEPFINPNAASVDEIISIIKKCPSGALSYTAKDDPVEENTESTVMVAPNGPYVVSGAVELLETNRGEGASETQMTLCRCGASKNKPFCDGSHWTINFKDEKN